MTAPKHIVQVPFADGTHAASEFLPSPDLSDFPATALPANPVLSWNTFFGGDNRRTASLLDVGEALLTTSGRAAIELALRLMKVGAGDEVLAPAYHCSSMIEPLRHHGVTCRFYRIKPDTSVDIDDVDRRITSRTRVLLVAHYFGFPQDVRALRTFCDDRGLMLLEDCAHAFFGEFEGKPLGSFGDYAIGSLMKFFPVYDGGCLVSARHSLDDIKLHNCPAAFQIRALGNAFERALNCGNLVPLNYLFRPVVGLKNFLRSRYKQPSAGTTSISATPAASDGGFGFDPNWSTKKISIPSGLIFRYSSTAHNIARRRRNYIYLVERLSRIRDCQVLIPNLPDHVVPYVVPILLKTPDPYFWELRRKAIPLLRWEFLSDEITPAEYPVSVSYSRRLIQVPCHQSLRTKDLDWIVRLCASVYGEA